MRPRIRHAALILAILAIAAIFWLGLGRTETDAIKLYEIDYSFPTQATPDNGTITVMRCHIDLELTNVWRRTIHPDSGDFHLAWRDNYTVGEEDLSLAMGIRSELKPGQKDYITLIYQFSNKTTVPRHIVFDDGVHEQAESLRSWRRESPPLPTNPIALSIAVAGAAVAVWVWDREWREEG